MQFTKSQKLQNMPASANDKIYTNLK